MTNLSIYDLHHCVSRLPKKFFGFIKKHGSSIIIAGGYIRSIITGERVSDIDCFAGGIEVSKAMALDLEPDPKKLIETENAITLRPKKSFPIQFIHRWAYKNPEECVASFDFTICQAAIWYDSEVSKWNSLCSDQFYPDLSARRLIYTWPERNEEPGGSILRVLKYYQRGYRIPLDSFAAVLSRLMNGVDFERIEKYGDMKSRRLAKVICGLLVEVDPNGFIDHEAYLPRVESIIETLEPNQEESLGPNQE